MRLWIVSALSLLALTFALALHVAPSQAKDKKGKAENVWAEGVPYVTDWDEAIKQAKTTGRLLFIYNGWKAENT